MPGADVELVMVQNLHLNFLALKSACVYIYMYILCFEYFTALTFILPFYFPGESSPNLLFFLLCSEIITNV